MNAPNAIDAVPIRRTKPGEEERMKDVRSRARWWVTARRRLRPGLLVAGLVLGVGGVVLGPASPALASCWENSCNGLSPTAQGCSAASTPGNRTISDTYTIQLRWSSGCWAYWARAKQATCYSGSPIAYARMQRQLWSPYGYYDTNVYYSGQVPCDGNYAVTSMVGDVAGNGYRYRACVAWAFDLRSPSSWPESWWYCVDWVYD
jgi:hypothetical protein